ncbi:hypothetical protein QBC39DRAFT_63720 [Podospora conica]|nr:hypothetical protein QBC39DRAFT_63720 [Schizothecium conicum]
MKSTLAILFSAVLGLAAPSVPAPDAFPYRLKITSANEKYNGKYISTNGSFVGIFRTGASTPLQVYAVQGSSGLVELRTYPESQSSQSLVLLGGENDNLALTTIHNPAAATFPRGTTCDWTSFKLGGGNPPAAGRGDNVVTYARAKSGDTFSVTDYGARSGTAVQLRRGDLYHIDISFPVTITYERVTDSSDEYTIM